MGLYELNFFGGFGLIETHLIKFRKLKVRKKPQIVGRSLMAVTLLGLIKVRKVGINSVRVKKRKVSTNIRGKKGRNEL